MKSIRLLIYNIYLFTLAIPNTVFAQKYTIENAEGFAEKAAKGAGVEAPSVEGIIGNLGRGALTFVGLLFFILMVYGGFKWMLARGNEEEVTKARKTVFAAMIGLFVVILGYALTLFVGGIIR